jgi:hypothetical protein
MGRDAASDLPSAHTRTSFQRGHTRQLDLLVLRHPVVQGTLKLHCPNTPLPPEPHRPWADLRSGAATTTQGMLHMLTPGGAFLVYALELIMAWCFIRAVVPETKGRSLEQLEAYFKSQTS